MIRSRWIVAAALSAALAGCGPRPPAAKTIAHETDCEEAVSVLLRARDAGETCEEGKTKALAAVPSCPLVFSCDRAAHPGAP